MFRAAFLRSVMEALERLSGGNAEAQLQLRLSESLRRMAMSHVLKVSGADILLSLDDVENFLLGVDEALGDGSGSILESVGQELATRSYLLGEGIIKSGSARRCVERFGDELLYPFEGTETQFQVAVTDTGFNLALGVRGRPRATRILRHLATGSVRASFTFALEATSTDLKLYAHTVGDRAEISARYRHPSETAELTPPPPARERGRPSRTSNAPPSVAREVERILSGAPNPRTEPPPSSRRGDHGLHLGAKIPTAPRLPSVSLTKRK